MKRIKLNDVFDWCEEYAAELFATITVALGVVLIWVAFPELNLTVHTLKDAFAETAYVHTTNSIGSGVVFTRQDRQGNEVTFIWTCAHLFRDDDATNQVDPFLIPVKVTIGGEKVSATLVAIGEPVKGVDLALLRADVSDLHAPSVSFYRGLPLAHGTKIYHVGAFYGFPPPESYSEGVISCSHRPMDNGEYDEILCPVYPGSSGGGVFDADGECIGLVDFRIDCMLGFSIPSKTIIAWAKAKHVAYAVDNSVPLP